MGSHKVSPQPTVNMQLLLGLLAQCSLLLALPTSDLPEVDTRVVNKPDQQRNCREGSDRGHDSLDNGCLLRIDFKRYHDQCKNSKLSFPTDEETPWHPEPSCNGEYCQESSKLEFSDRTGEETDVAFPDEKPY